MQGMHRQEVMQGWNDKGKKGKQMKYMMCIKPSLGVTVGKIYFVKHHGNGFIRVYCDNETWRIYQVGFFEEVQNEP